MPADCILHVEHHDLSDDCVRAILEFTQTAKPSPDFPLWELYESAYEDRACIQVVSR